MFVILATKSLSDGTRGLRFNFFGQKGLIRFRKQKSMPFAIVKKDCMTQYNFRKVSLYMEHSATRRKLRHFAG